MSLFPIVLGGEVFSLPGWVEQHRQERFLAPFLEAHRNRETSR